MMGERIGWGWGDGDGDGDMMIIMKRYLLMIVGCGMCDIY